MLADQFVAFPLSPEFAEMPDEMKLIYKTVASKLKACPRFVLDRPAALMIHNVSTSSPQSLLSALDICRLPFVTMWVEFDYAHRAEWLKTLPEKIAQHEDASDPSRIGFLMEAKDPSNQVIEIMPLWSHPGTEIPLNYSHLAFSLDTRKDFVPNDEDRKRGHEVLSSSEKSVWIRNPQDRIAMGHLAERTDSIIPSYMGPLWKGLTRSSQTAAKIVELAQHGLGGRRRCRCDAWAWWAAIAILLKLILFVVT